jgi:hypothetical protein
VSYCSAECQKAHWKEGGHKKQCKALQASVPAKAASTSAVAEKSSSATSHTTRVTASAAVSDGRACIICLEPDPQPIQSGCACRGDAGLAHVECRISAAEHKQKSSGSMAGWEGCLTCGQLFHGEMGLALAEEFWRRTSKRRPEKMDGQYLSAARMRSNALLSAGKDADAEAFCRQTVSVLERSGVDPKYIAFSDFRFMLACALTNQQKNVEAESILRRCVADFTRTYGPDSADTLNVAMQFGDCLDCQGKHVEAATILRDTSERAKRALGPEHIITLQCDQSLAKVFFLQGKPDESLAVFKKLLPVMKRVLGSDHETVVQTTRSYAVCLASFGRLDDAEALLVGVVEAQKRVFGAGHVDTVLAAQELAKVRAKMGK